MEYISKYLKQVENIAKKIDQNKIESVILEILKVKKHFKKTNEYYKLYRQDIEIDSIDE